MKLRCGRPELGLNMPVGVGSGPEGGPQGTKVQKASWPVGKRESWLVRTRNKLAYVIQHAQGQRPGEFSFFICGFSIFALRMTKSRGKLSLCSDRRLLETLPKNRSFCLLVQVRAAERAIGSCQFFCV